MSKVTSAVILAAGLGSRLKSLTQQQPKALMLVAGEPVIVHVIRHLVAQGIRDIAINIHHHAKQLTDYLGAGAAFHANVYYSHEHTLLDSGGGVRTAMQLLPPSALVAVHNADIAAAIPMQKLAGQCPPAGCALALVPNPKHHLAGDFSLQGNSVVAGEMHRHTFSGVSVWHQDALLAHPAQQKFSLIEPIRASIQHQRCAGLIHHGAWFDIGRHRDLVQANRLFMR